MKPFGEDNLDVLQNIEFAIVTAYRENPAITDFDVKDGLDALTRQYSAEVAGRVPSTIPLDPRARAVYDETRRMCEWRMGRDAGAVDRVAPVVLGLDDIVTALRTIRKSIQRWSDRGGKRGYLDFVKNYLP